MKKEEKLRKLYRENKYSEECKNLDIAENKTFVSDLSNGNPNSNLFFVGEAPGKNEEEMGFPFQGQAGDIFNEYIERIGLKREDIWVGNVVPYRPTKNGKNKNRKPKKSEIVACLPILRKEIEIIDPKIIITLGVTALNSLTQNKYKLKQVSGELMQYNNKLLFPTYHPSAAYRFPKIEKKFKGDFYKLKKLLREEMNVF